MKSGTGDRAVRETAVEPRLTMGTMDMRPRMIRDLPGSPDY